MIWSSNFAYAVGLITTDGCLSKDGRHIDLTSKDLEQIKNLKKILKLTNKIGLKYARSDKSKYYYHIQFGNIKLYRFLVSIGITPKKSKTLKAIKIPDKYFADFLRGCLDGDGCTFSYWSKQWPNSFVMYTSFTSASPEFLVWLRQKIFKLYKVIGSINQGRRAQQLRFAKKSSLILIKNMYYSSKNIHLSRKKFKIDQTLGIIGRKEAGVL